MKNWAILGTIIAFIAGLSMFLAPTSLAMPYLMETSKAIDPFGENVVIVISTDSHKTKHPAPGGPGAGDPNPGGQDQVRVDVCHKGKTKSIDPSKVADHLAHGDTLGAC